VTNARKAQGTRFESAVVGYLRENGFPEAHRLPPRGMMDEGDIAGVPLFAVECKDWKSPDYPLFTRLARVKATTSGKPFGVTIQKLRRQSIGQSIVVMDLDAFISLSTYINERNTP
jgi:hypothetical protein